MPSGPTASALAETLAEPVGAGQLEGAQGRRPALEKLFTGSWAPLLPETGHSLGPQALAQEMGFKHV